MIILRIFRYREITARTKFDACCCDTDKMHAAAIQTEKLVLLRKSPLLKNRSFLWSDFKNLKSVGVP
jgi:hypothetical protein